MFASCLAQVGSGWWWRMQVRELPLESRTRVTLLKSWLADNLRTGPCSKMNLTCCCYATSTWSPSIPRQTRLCRFWKLFKMAQLRLVSSTYLQNVTRCSVNRPCRPIVVHSHITRAKPTSQERCGDLRTLVMTACVISRPRQNA